MLDKLRNPKSAYKSVQRRKHTLVARSPEYHFMKKQLTKLVLLARFYLPSLL